VGDEDVAERVAGPRVLDHRDLELLVGDEAAVDQHPRELDPRAALLRGLDLALGGRVDVVDGRGDLVARVAHEVDLAVDALLDHLAGDRVVDLGGRDEHGPVGDGVRDDAEGAADALGQQVPEVGGDAVGQPDPHLRGGGGRRHQAPAPNPEADGAAGEPGAVELGRLPRERQTT
jgi:hypothetical protein